MCHSALFLRYFSPSLSHFFKNTGFPWYHFTVRPVSQGHVHKLFEVSPLLSWIPLEHSVGNTLKCRGAPWFHSGVGVRPLGPVRSRWEALSHVSGGTEGGARGLCSP